MQGCTTIGMTSWDPARVGSERCETQTFNTGRSQNLIAPKTHANSSSLRVSTGDKYRDDIKNFRKATEETLEGPLGIYRETAPQNWRPGHFAGKDCCAQVAPEHEAVSSVESNYFNIEAHRVLSGSAVPVLRIWWPTLLLNGTDGAQSRCTPDGEPEIGSKCGVSFAG